MQLHTFYFCDITRFKLLTISFKNREFSLGLFTSMNSSYVLHESLPVPEKEGTMNISCLKYIGFFDEM